MPHSATKRTADPSAATGQPLVWAVGATTDVSIDPEIEEWRVSIEQDGSEVGAAYGSNRAEVEANARRMAATPTLIAALEAVLPDLGELLTHWQNEAASFDLPCEEAERNMAQTNAESTRRNIALVQAALQLAGPRPTRKPSARRSRQ